MKRAVTLIDVCIVIVILMILAMVVIPWFTDTNERETAEAARKVSYDQKVEAERLEREAKRLKRLTAKEVGHGVFWTNITGSDFPEVLKLLSAKGHKITRTEPFISYDSNVNGHIIYTERIGEEKPEKE